MSGNEIPRFDEVTWSRRVQALQNAAIRLQTQRDDARRNLESTKAKIEKLSSDLELYLKAGELLRALMDKLALDYVKVIESVVSEGLRSIFVDQDLAFIAEVGHFRNKVSIELLVRRERNGVEVVGPPLESTGGGVSSIASLTLRLLALMRLKKFPLLLLDETLSAVSDDYVDATGQFLGKLAETTGIPILLVTHKQSFLEHAKNAYQGHEETLVDGSLGMSLTKMRGSR